MTESKVSLKLLIDKKGQRVLFAEAGKDFVDFLFTLLTLPFGSAIRLLDNKGMVGSLGKLYQSVADLSDDYMQSNQQKDLVLKSKSSLSAPISTQVSLLPPQEWSPTTTAKKFYYCSNCTNGLLYPTSCDCPICSRNNPYSSTRMSNYVTHYVPKTSADPATAGEGGFVKGLVTYMVMDDLVVSPMSTISTITLLNKFNIKDISALEEKVVNVGMDEGLELLKHAWGSKTVLTNVFLAIKDENLSKV